ncbi:MAG TPA: transcriptional regulator [Pirellulaceae bacterium]|jgi:predicted DNA-binding transcriptional regulator YafY|nr:transcriptional regulator [Pirellulaceae bacterium]
MARNEQLIRQHKILQLLERARFGKTLQELVDDLVDELGLSGLSDRTVRRDLEALQAAGIDVDSHESQRGKIWKLGPGTKGVHKITASATELIALSLGRDLLTPLMGTVFWQGIETFWKNIQEELTEPVWDHYQKYRQVLYVLGTPAKTYTEQQGIIKTINRAILEHRVVEIEYQAIGKPLATKLIEPYAVALYQSSLYIICGYPTSPADKSGADGTSAPAGTAPIVNLKLDRFQKATALDHWYKPRSHEEIDEYVRSRLGIFSSPEMREYVLKISQRAAPWVLEDPWRSDQETEELPDGSLLLRVQAGHDLEIIPKALALGAEAEILEPASCRDAVREMVERMHATYSRPAPAVPAPAKALVEESSAG